MNIWTRHIAGLTFFVASALPLFGGGSGLNVAVVANADSADSLQLANYYCEKRQVPPQNVLRIHWTGANKAWALSQYETALSNPLQTMLSERGLTNQIEFVLLSMDIPYKINQGFEHINSTTSTLFYGFKPDTNSPADCPIATNSASAYAGSESIFRETPPISADSNSFLAVMITASNLAKAKQIVDNGVFGDSTFPTQTVYLLKTTDGARNVRYPFFDNAIFNTRVRGDYDVVRTNSNEATNFGSIFGLQTGRVSFSLADTAFSPGAMADNLTSFGGFLFENRFGQTIVLDVLHAGAAGSYGTVVEPCNYIEKFPIPQNYFFQSRGFSLAESYYQSVTNPYEGLIVGEPLSAPFAQPCEGSWSNLPPSALLSGTTNLSVHFTAADATRPVQQVDLFLDGTFFATITNVAPSEGNDLSVTINGSTTDCSVSAGDSIGSVASNLASRMNAIPYRNFTKVTPFVHGDRIELQSTDANSHGTDVSIVVSNDVGSASALSTFVSASRSDFLDTIAYGVRTYTIGVGVVTNDVLTASVTKTNGANVSVSITNYVEGTTLSQFIQQLMNAINSTTSLQGDDGLLAEDFGVVDTNYVQFTLRARSPGFDASRIQVSITGTFNIDPSGLRRLDENIGDLRPRNHLYISAGTTNLSLEFPFDTTTIADGWHELTAVAYEGSHVRTQKRIARTVQIQNSTLSATFNCIACDMNTGVEGVLPFSVEANTNIITRIELFSTGGSWGIVSNQSSAFFSVPAADLQLGRHPFYAIVTRDDGAQYHTETKWLQIEPSFPLSITGLEPTLSWPAETGVTYEVFSTTNAAEAFQSRGSLEATNSTAQWMETNNAPEQQFYRVRVLP